MVCYTLLLIRWEPRVCIENANIAVWVHRSPAFSGVTHRVTASSGGPSRLTRAGARRRLYRSQYEVVSLDDGPIIDVLDFFVGFSKSCVVDRTPRPVWRSGYAVF